VGEKYGMSGGYFQGKRLQRYGGPLRITLNQIRGQNKLLTWHQLNRATLNDSDSNLWTLKILKNRHRLIQFFSGALDAPYQCMQVLVCAMGKIDPRNIHPRSNKFFDHLFGIA